MDNLDKQAKDAVATVIKSSINHAGLLAHAAGLCVLLMADGRAERFNELFNGVSTNDSVALRSYLRNIHATFGWTETNNAGREMVRGPFTVREVTDSETGKKVAAWSLIAESENRKAACKRIKEAGIERLSKIALHDPADERRGAKGADFDLNESLAKLIRRAAKAGVPMGRVQELNSLLGKGAIPKAELESLRGDVSAKLEKARADVAKFERIANENAKVATPAKGKEAAKAA